MSGTFEFIQSTREEHFQTRFWSILLKKSSSYKNRKKLGLYYYLKTFFLSCAQMYFIIFSVYIFKFAIELSYNFKIIC